MKRPGLTFKIVILSWFLVIGSGAPLIYFTIRAWQENFGPAAAEKLGPFIPVIAGLFIGFMLLGILLARVLTRKARYLNRIAKDVSLGQLDEPIFIKSGDEIGQLGQSLERLRVSLKMALKMIEEREGD